MLELREVHAAYGHVTALRGVSLEVRAGEIVALLGDVRRLERALGWTLSGGQQQMLAIARGLMARPRLLLMDEPSLGLAPILVQSVFRTVEQINREFGTTVLLVEQNASMALGIAARGYVLETGRVVLAGAAGRALRGPAGRRAGPRRPRK